MKDFVLHESQLDWALSLGADAVLLIVAALPDETLLRLHRAARERGLAVLVEAHDAGEVKRAQAAGAAIIGINARNLSTFEVDLPAMGRLAAELPAGVIRVAESGIRSAEDVAALSGFQAFLVGESLLRADDRVAALRKLTGRGPTRVKVCGVTREEDAAFCSRSGVDWVGLNFSPGSPRRIPVERAASLMKAAEGVEGVVAVFAGNGESEIHAIAEALRPGVLQLTDPPGPAVTGPWNCAVWQTVRVGEDDLEAARGWPGDALLLDTAVRGARGGTGIPFDWRAVAAIGIDRRIVAAGGLGPANVAEAIRALRPWGVDAASGLESAPGIKDHGRIEAFVRAVRGPEKELRG